MAALSAHNSTQQYTNPVDGSWLHQKHQTHTVKIFLFFLMKEMVPSAGTQYGQLWDMIGFRRTNKAGSPKYVRTP
jgi:hypothetical protein